MKTIIAGSRTITDSQFRDAIGQSLLIYDANPIISGGAPGADSSAIAWAVTYDRRYQVFKADWETHGKAAGPIRNQEMLKSADALIAIWDGNSSGTVDMVTRWVKEKGEAKCEIFLATKPHKARPINYLQFLVVKTGKVMLGDGPGM